MNEEFLKTRPYEETPLTPEDKGRWRTVRKLLPFIWFFIIVVFSIFNFFFATSDWRGGALAGSDAQAYYAPLRSLVIDGDLDFQNEFGELNFHGHGRDALMAWPRSPHTGLIFNRFPIGYALLFAPFFLAAHVLSHIGHSLGLDFMQPDGYSALYQVAIVMNAWFWSAAAYFTHRLVLRRYFSPTVSDWATFVMFLSFQGVFNSITFWINPHMQSLFVFSLLFLVLARIDDGDSRTLVWAGAGGLTGLLALLRTECGIIALYSFLMFLLVLWREWVRYTESAGPFDKPVKKRRFLNLFVKGLAAPLAFLAVFFLQLMVWRLLWGRWFVVPVEGSETGSFNWGQPALLNILFSTRHGLFYWSPILFPAFIAFVVMTFSSRADSTLRVGFVQLVALYYLYASWFVWWMGYSFGARQFIVITPLFGIGLGLIVEQYWRYRRLLLSLGGLFILWNFVMLWMFLNGHIPRSGEHAFHYRLPLRKAVGLVLEKIGL